MALLTNKVIAKELLDVLYQKSTLLRMINTQYSDEFAKDGAKLGNSVDIRVPMHGKVRTGRIMDTNAPNDKVVSLKIDEQQGVDLSFSSADRALNIDRFRERYLEQPAADLTAYIEAAIIRKALASVYNQVGDPATALDLKKALLANKMLTDNLAPAGKRTMLTNTSGTVQVVDGTKTLFNSQAQIKDQYEDGVMGVAAGFTWAESTLMPSQTNGAGTGYVVGAAGQSGSSLAVTTGTGPITAGTVFNIANVYAIHPQTKQSLGVLQDFVVTADYAGGAGNISISPALTPTGTEQNVTASPAAGAVITIDGAANTSYGVNLAFQKNFMAVAFVDMPLPENKPAERYEFNGISLRLVQDYDIVNDLFLTRTDVLFGSQVIRPELATRVANNITLL